jgi:F-type H+-transporting ATPase subunit delta
MIVASRYARSLMELASEGGKLDKVRDDMKELIRVIEENRDFRLFLKSPIIKADKKEKVLAELFKGKVAPLTFEFMRLLTRKHREGILYEIALAFDEHYKKSKNILTAIVTSANGLDKTTKKKLQELVESQTRGEVEIIEKVDPSAIGGFILRIGDRQIDKTVARQLSNLKKELINN